MRGILYIWIAAAVVLAACSDAVRASQRSYPIVDTGQSRCYDDRGQVIQPKEGEAFYGQDAQYDGIEPSYRDNGDGTITDLNTGLMWQKSPDFNTLRSWSEAAAYAESLALRGYEDWRVPTIEELYSLTNFDGSQRQRKPYLNTEVFDFEYPGTSTGLRSMDAQYWSSNRYVGITMGRDRGAFGFNFADGRIKVYPPGEGGGPSARRYVRCVRGRTDYGVNKFVDNGDGTITDQATGLMWMQGDSGKTMNWEEALAYAEGLEFAGHGGWRLPNAKELQSIVDYTKAPDAVEADKRGPAIEPIFTLTETESWFWTSTTHGDNPRHAIYIAFGQAFSAWVRDGKKLNAHGAGAQRSDPKSGDPAQWAQGLGPQGDEIRILNYVRCVRDADK